MNNLKMVFGFVTLVSISSIANSSDFVFDQSTPVVSAEENNIVVTDVLPFEDNDMIYNSKVSGYGAFDDYKSYIMAGDDEAKRKLISNIIIKSVKDNDYRFVYSVMSMYKENIVGDISYRAVLENLVFNHNYLKAYSYLADIILKEGNIDRGLSILVNGADRGDDRSRYLLGKFYREGVYVQADEFFAMDWLLKVYGGAYRDKARYEVAQIRLENGDNESYFDLIVESADLGYPKACVDLTELYKDKYSSYDKDGYKIIKSMECAVVGGHHKYAFELAEYYYNGYLVDADIYKSVVFYNYFYNYAIVNKIPLGRQVIHKIAVARMRSGNLNAIELFEEASDLGFSESSYVMGKIYENGSGREQDFEKSLEYYSLSVEQGKESASDDVNRVQVFIDEDKIYYFDWFIK